MAEGHDNGAPETHPLARELLDARAEGQKDFARQTWESVSIPAADLSECDFQGAQFEDCILLASRFNKSNLQGARFKRCNLIQCIFQECNLTEANFDPSVLWRADFFSANLTRANLSNCDAKQSCMLNANLNETELQGASFRGAMFGMTFLSNVNLLYADLREIEHSYPSIINDATINKTAAFVVAANSALTLAKSGEGPTLDLNALEATVRQLYARVPDLRNFLLRAGCSKDDLQMIDAAVPDVAVEFASVFISYSTQDEHFARWLDAHLRSYGVDVWFAPNSMRGGQKIKDQLERAIGERDKIVLILSDSSLKSNWVTDEITSAFLRETEQGHQILYPIRIVDYEKVRQWKLFDSDHGVDIAKRVREYFIPDLSSWADAVGLPEELHRLVDDLRR